MRPSDIHALRRDDVDLDRRLIRFRAGKTGRDQVVPIGEHLAGHLEAWLRSSDFRRTRPLDGRLLHLDGRTVTHATLRRRWRRASKAADIAPPIEHIGLCRNSAIAYLLEDGASPFEVAELVGHSGLGLLMEYARRYVPLDALRRVAERADRLRAR